MTDNADNLILRHLQALREDVGDIKEELSRVNLRLGAIEENVATLVTLGALDRPLVSRRRESRLKRTVIAVQRASQFGDAARCQGKIVSVSMRPLFISFCSQRLPPGDCAVAGSATTVTTKS